MTEEQQPPPEDEELDLEVIDEETKIREDIANDFNVIISIIKTPFQSIFLLKKKKIIPDSIEAKALNLRTDEIYFLLNEEEEQDFFKYITELNEALGKANSILDSYVKFTSSSPDFKNFLNMFYIFIENYTKYRSTYFFQSHAEKGNYLYPFFEVDNVLVKLQFLFARLCGTLSVGARWIIIQPPASRSPVDAGNYSNDGYRPYHDMYDPFRYQPEQKSRYRDIGDGL